MRSVLAVAASACDVPSEDAGQQAGDVDILSVAAQGNLRAIEDVTACDAMDDSEDTISLGDSEEPFTFDVYMSIPSSSPHSPQPSGSSFPNLSNGSIPSEHATATYAIVDVNV
jgi:hypothetical protein